MSLSMRPDAAVRNDHGPAGRRGDLIGPAVVQNTQDPLLHDVESGGCHPGNDLSAG